VRSSPPLDLEIKNLLRRKARRLDQPRDLDEEARARRQLNQAGPLRRVAEPTMLSPSEASLAPFVPHTAASAAAEAAAERKRFDELERFARALVERPSQSTGSRLLTKFIPTR
jgi:hypothetical protein